MLQPDPALDAIRDAFLASIPEETATEEVAAEVQPESIQPTAEVQAEVQPSEPAAAPTEAPKTESEARAYRKLLDGEAKLRAERAAWEAERKSHEAELAAYRQVKDKVKTDPLGFLIGTGLSDKEVLEALQEAHARDLGNLAPAEVRAQLAAKKAERIALETEQKIRAEYEARERAKAEAEGQRFVAEYQAGLQQFASTGLNEFPQLAAVAAAGKPVVQALYQTAVEMAAANPNGNAPTYADVAKQLNDQLVELAKYVAPAQAAPTATPVTPAPPVAGKPVLRNSITQAQPAPVPDTKPRDYNEYVKDLRARVLEANGIPVR